MAIMIVGTIGAEITAQEVRTALETSEESVDIYLDSPGGDVIESNGISLAIAEYALKHPEKEYTATVGGLCASAAANILAKLPTCFKVSVFKDSLIMYHSCSGIVEGTPQQLRDFGTMMSLVNEAVIRELSVKTTLPIEEIKQAFQAGRELWLDGRKAVEVGLASELLDEAPQPVEFRMTTGATLKVLEMVAEYKHKLEEVPMNEEEKIETTAEEVIETTPTAEEEIDKQEIAEEVAEELNEAPAEPEIDWEAKAHALEAECDELKKELEALKAIVAKYQPTAKASASTTTPRGWLQMVRDLNAKHLNEQDYAKEYKALKQAHKGEFDAFMKEKSIR